MTKILLLENPHSCADPILTGAGFEVQRVNGALEEDELIEALKGVQVVGIRSKTTISQRVLQSCPQLEAIGAFCIGTNQIDLPQASRQGIAVFNAPYSNTRSVVEMAISQIIALTRRLPERNRDLQAGLWVKSADGSHEVRGKTLGLIGYGNIGTQLSVLAEAMGMKVVFYDLAQKLALGNAQRLNSMNEVLEISDFVSLHVDGNPDNKGMFGAEQIAKMKPGAILINLSRGFVLDNEALALALKNGHLAGAGVDVFPSEPNKNGETFDNPLVGLKNTILTPHIGGSTLEAQYDIGVFTADKLVQYIRRGDTSMSVNMPNVSLIASNDTLYRTALIHRNTPGVLGILNNVFAQHGANIEGQVLGTMGEYAYAITDISSDLPQESLNEIRSLPSTVRLRIMTRR